MTQKKSKRSGRGDQPTERIRARKKKTTKKRPRIRPGIDSEFLQEKKLRDQDVPHAKSLFLEAWERTGYISEACRAAGIGRRTYYEWITKDPEFKAQAKESRKIWRATAMEDLETSFAERGASRDTLAGIFLLKHNKRRYREVSRVELSGPDGGPMVTIEAKEELIKRLERLSERAARKEQIIGGVAVGSLPAGPTGSAGSAKSELRVIRAGSAGSERGVRKQRGP